MTFTYHPKCKKKRKKNQHQKYITIMSQTYKEKEINHWFVFFFFSCNHIKIMSLLYRIKLCCCDWLIGVMKC